MHLKEEIGKILSPPHELFSIISSFDKWSQAQREALLAEADSWLLQLYEIDIHFFMSFLIANVPINNPKLVTEIYQRAEKDGHQQLFNTYYATVPNEQINQEIQAWISQKLSVDDLLNRLRWRLAHPKKLLITEASLIAIYNLSPRILEVDLLNDFFRYHRILFEESKHEKFRVLVKKAMQAKKPSTVLYHYLLNLFASESEKRAEVKAIIETASTWAEVERELSAYGLPLTDDELEIIQKRFNQGDSRATSSVNSFMLNHSKLYAKNLIESELAKAKTEAQMEEIAGQLRNKINWQRFYELIDTWLVKVYELAPTFCLSMVNVYNPNLKISGKTASALLKKVQQNNHREMLRFVNAHLYSQTQWNQMLLDLAQGEMSLNEKTRALEDLDCQPRYAYHGQNRAYLTDEVAAALYQASPSYLHSFIWHNLAPKQFYPLLLKASKGTEDYYVIFRQVADGQMWKEEMQALLSRDLPAEEIEGALERYQLNRGNNAIRGIREMDARVLKGFIDKYGEAVLPYFERYVRWATEGRLKSLLALDIDRAELLRELNVLARREPEAFSRLSHVWALPLYERGAKFFESFLIRYIGRQNEYVTRQLLTRAKADKQLNLFRALYRIVVTGAAWNQEFADFIGKSSSEEALAEFVEWHDIPNWDYTLNDAIAAKLYQLNPEKFSPFILRHLSQQARWGNRLNYDRLLKAAESNPEYHLAFLKSLAYEKYWKAQIESLLKSQLTGEEALARLEELHPRNTWEVQDTSLLKKVFDKYGADVAPYIVKNIHWLKADGVFMELLEQRAPSSLFWEAVFATINTHGNAAWSYNRWSRALEELYKQDLSDAQVSASLEMLSPIQESRWRRYQISEQIGLALYQKHPKASRGFIQTYYTPKFDNFLMFDEASRQNDEEMLDFLSFSAMGKVNNLIHRAFPPNPAYQRADKNAQAELKTISDRIIERFDSLQQRGLYVRHAALMLSWWRPFAIWNAEAMMERNPIYQYIVSQHINAWMDSPEAIREVLESPNIFVQLIGLNLLRAAEHELLAQRIQENKRIFRQLLLGRARRSTKRLALNCLEQAIALNPAFAPELLPILEEAADFYGRLALSEDMMIHITRIKYALEQV